MLEIVNYNEGEYEFPCLLVLGCFDGLHIGHAELLKKAKLQAKINGLDLGVMMFADGKGGKQLCSFEDRVALLEQYNVKFVLKIEFTNDFKNTSPLDFLQILEDKLNVKAYMSGKDFRFGAGAKGKASTLKNYGEDEENGVWYMSVKDVLSGSDKVSTSFIKTLIENGDLPRANELLGRNFSVSGTVIETCGSTVKIAYPENIVKLKNGRYSVKCTVGGNEYNGSADVGDILQLNLEDFGGNIDGQQVRIEFSACLDLSEACSDAQNEEQSAVEELAVADGEGGNVETAEPSETVEPAENVEEGREESEQQLSEENFAEDSEFEEELDEEFSEQTAEAVVEETVEEADGSTLTEIAEESEEQSEDTADGVAAEPSEETIGETVEENPEELSEAAFEPLEKNEADESYTLTEIAEEPTEEAAGVLPEENGEGEEISDSAEIPENDGDDCGGDAEANGEEKLD